MSIKLHFLSRLNLKAKILTVVLLVTVVGIVLVIALLTLPAAIAGRFSRSLRQMMVWSTVLCALFTIAGLSVSYGPDLPAGPMIIVITGATHFAVMLAGGALQRLRNSAA